MYLYFVKDITFLDKVFYNNVRNSVNDVALCDVLFVFCAKSLHSTLSLTLTRTFL